MVSLVFIFLRLRFGNEIPLNQFRSCLENSTVWYDPPVYRLEVQKEITLCTSDM